MSAPAIHASGLGKKYRIGAAVGPYRTLRQAIVDTAMSPLRRIAGRHVQDREVWALKDVSFDIAHGEVVGIVGRNGAGKSTLLKVLARITEPSTGRAEIRGRVGSLLEVGTGFHPELTGRENILLSGTILGMTRLEVRQKFDEIVEFAGTGEYLDTPVKHYSTGMHTRLAFAVAAHLDTDILLVDEVLAVGDLAFQKKCLGRMNKVAHEGRTVVFVSHNLGAVWSLCPTCLWIDGGTLREFGPSPEVLERYRQAMVVADDDLVARQDTRLGTGRFRVTALYLRDADGKRRETVRAGDPVDFVLEYASREPTLRDVEVNLLFVNEREVRLFALTTKVSGSTTTLPGTARVVFTLPRVPLMPAEYYLHFSCHTRGLLADKAFFAARFSVVEGDYFGNGRLPSHVDGEVLVDQSWRIEQSGEAPQDPLPALSEIARE